MDANDLINPLRYVNLKEINPDSINRMGEGVFPEPGTLDHLAIIDLVTKAYQGVHLPTFGKPIPQSTNSTTVTQTDSQTELNLLTANNNEVLEILSISCSGGTSVGLSAASLRIYNSNSLATCPIIQIPLVDDLTASFSGLIYGHVVEVTNFKQIMQPVQLLLNGGESLSIQTKSTPSASITWTILYRKVSQ